MEPDRLTEMWNEYGLEGSGPAARRTRSERIDAVARWLQQEVDVELGRWQSRLRDGPPKEYVAAAVAIVDNLDAVVALARGDGGRGGVRPVEGLGP